MSAADVPEADCGYPASAKDNPDERPTPIGVDPDEIAAELISYPHWVCWRFMWRDDRGEDGEWSKVPINPETGENARANDPNATAGSFEDALDYHQRDDTNTDGLGFVLTDSPFSGVDLDDLYDPATGEWDETGREIIDTLDSYSEFSPSARGGHVLMIGELPDGGRKNDPIEMYDSGRYFTVTGRRVPDTPEKIPDRETGEERLADVHRLAFPDEYTADDDDEADEGDRDVPEIVDLADEELIEKAKNAENGEKFSDLWEGSTDGYDYDSHSEADAALCEMLAFWTGGNADRIDRLFRDSGLMREKWDGECTGRGDTYGEHTIGKAIDRTDEWYDPHYNSEDDEDADDGDQDRVPDPTNDNGRTAWDYVRHVYAESGRKRGRSLAADALEDRTSWAYVREEDRLWVYDDDRGTFNEWGKEIAAGMLEAGLGDQFSQTEVNEIVGRIEARNQVHRRELNGGEHPEPRACVGNGVVDLKTGELYDHDPSYLFTRGLDWDYDPDEADREPVLAFLDDITEKEEHRDTILDHLALGLMPGHPYRKFVFTYGDGANGKTQLQNLIEGFVGEENAASVSLNALTGGDDFATGALPGSFVNIGDDEGIGEIRDTSMLKSLTGGGSRRANTKNEKQYSFKNEAAMFFSANEPPRIVEDKGAINDRLYPIELPYEFKPASEYDPENPLHKRRTPRIAHTLTSDDEAMKGLLALVVEHAQRVIASDGDYSMSEGPAERRAIYDAASDPIARFVTRCLEQGDDDMLAKDDVYAVYTELCRAENERMTDLDKFKREFAKKSTLDVETTRPRHLTPKSGRDPAWKYIRFAEEAQPFMSERLIDRYFGDADDAAENTRDTPADRATPIDELEHGDGNPYRTIMAAVKAVDATPPNGPAAAGVLEDTTGKIDFVAWNDSQAAAALSDPGREGSALLIEDARMATDADGNDILDIEHAEIRPIGAGVGHLPLERAGANETLADGSGDGDDHDQGDDSPVPDDAEGITADAQRIAHIAKQRPSAIGKADLAARAGDQYGMNPDRAMTSIEKAIDRGLLIDEGNNHVSPGT